VVKLKDDMLEDLAVCMELAEQLEPWIRTVKKTAHEQLEAGATIEGYKLVASQARRAWADEDSVLNVLKRMRKLSRDKYMNSKLVSVAQLEKICKHEGVDFDRFTDYYTMVSKGTAVVPESDPRQGIRRTEGRDVPERLAKLMKQT